MLEFHHHVPAGRMELIQEQNKLGKLPTHMTIQCQAGSS